MHHQHLPSAHAGKARYGKNLTGHAWLILKIPYVKLKANRACQPRLPVNRILIRAKSKSTPNKRNACRSKTMFCTHAIRQWSGKVQSAEIGSGAGRGQSPSSRQARVQNSSFMMITTTRPGATIQGSEFEPRERSL